MQLYVWLNGEQNGPHELEQIQDMLDSGVISPSDLGWYEGLSEWQPLNTFLTLEAADPDLEPSIAAAEPVSPALKTDVREVLPNLLPRSAESGYRVVVSDVVDGLAKSLWFQIKIVVTMSLVFGAFAVGALGLLGYSISETAKREIDQAKKDVDDKIAVKFKDENIQKTVQDVAANQAADLLQKHVQPSIDGFNKHLDDTKVVADKELSTFRDELAKLETRNQILEMGDKAISRGDAFSYKKILMLTIDPASPYYDAAKAEEAKIMLAYGPLGITWDGVTLVASKINPTKTREDQLDSNDLLKVISNNTEPRARYRAAQLLQKVGKPGSYSTASALLTAIESENQILVIQQLKGAFSHIVPSFQDGQFLDGEDVIEWWRVHESDVKKTDTDSTPSPAIPAH